MKIEMILTCAAASFFGTWVAWAYLKRRSSMTIRLGGGFIVALVALASYVGAIGVLFPAKQSDADVAMQQKISPQNVSVEYKFAVVNAGHLVSESDPSVARAHELLSVASEGYGIPQSKAADVSFAVADALSKDGVSVSPMEVLEAAALVNVGISDFENTAVHYAEIRKSGRPHAEAMLGLKSLMQSIKDATK